MTAIVMVAVHDGGVGIRASDLDCVFGAFSITKPDGMGMGLSISGSIIEVRGRGDPSSDPSRTTAITSG